MTRTLGAGPGSRSWSNYKRRFQVERLFRDARITEIYEGATDIQRIVVSRAVLA